VEKIWCLHFPMPTFWLSMHHYLHDAKCPFLPNIHRIKCFVNQRNHLLSWTHHVAPTTFVCVVNKFGAMCDQFPSMKQPKLLTFCLFMEHIIGIFWPLIHNKPLHGLERHLVCCDQHGNATLAMRDVSIIISPKTLLFTLFVGPFMPLMIFLILHSMSASCKNQFVVIWFWIHQPCFLQWSIVLVLLHILTHWWIQTHVPKKCSHTFQQFHFHTFFSL
jgi:hypothetical protein